MFTNTYYPSVGGIEKSVHDSAAEMRRQGHQVLVVAPAYRGATDSTATVLRAPAIKQINGSPHSISLYLPERLAHRVMAFKPDMVHSHQPFLLGDSAVRLARALNVPIIYTHHTFMERYLHWFPVGWRVLHKVALKLPISYAKLVDHVVTPTHSVAQIMRERGMQTPITVIPTGIDAQFYASGDRAAFREAHGLPADCFVLGHLGRLNPEKNLAYLAQVAAAFIKRDRARFKFLLVGTGESVPMFEQVFAEHQLSHCLISAGLKLGQSSADAYAAMDAFVFTSLTDTQGLVLSEAMAAGNPVFALDAPGARDMIAHGHNGYLFAQGTDPDAFATQMQTLIDDPLLFANLRSRAAATAATVSLPSCCQSMLQLYDCVIATTRTSFPGQRGRRWRVEKMLLREKLACLFH